MTGSSWVPRYFTFGESLISEIYHHEFSPWEVCEIAGDRLHIHAPRRLCLIAGRGAGATLCRGGGRKWSVVNSMIGVAES